MYIGRESISLMEEQADIPIVAYARPREGGGV